MKYIYVHIILLTFLFSSVMEIDSSFIRDSHESFRWSLIPIVSQGQMYNKKYLKSLFFTGFQSYTLSRMLNYNKLISKEEFLDNGILYEPDEYILKRNIYGWWFIAMYALSIIDSYVDAELSIFPNRLK